MKHRPLLFSIIVVALTYGILSTNHVYGQGLGFSAGLNYNELSDISSDTDVWFENATGWHVSLWFDLPLGPLALRPGVRYMDVGSIFENVGTNTPNPFTGDDFSVRLLEVPIDLRIRLPFPIITPYVLGGPVLRFPADNDQQIEDRLESFSFAGELGAGLEIKLGAIRLFPELKYTFGLSRFTKEQYELLGMVIIPNDDQNLNTVMLCLGIGL